MTCRGSKGKPGSSIPATTRNDLPREQRKTGIIDPGYSTERRSRRSERGAHLGEAAFGGGLGDRSAEEFLEVHLFHELRGKLLDEGAGLAGHGAPELGPEAAMGQGQGPHGTGDSDVEEAAFFVQGALTFGAVVRQDPLLQADDVDVRELKAFGRVHGDQGNASLFVDVVLLFFLALLVQDDFIEKTAQTLGRSPGELFE